MNNNYGQDNIANQQDLALRNQPELINYFAPYPDENLGKNSSDNADMAQYIPFPKNQEINFLSNSEQLEINKSNQSNHYENFLEQNRQLKLDPPNINQLNKPELKHFQSNQEIEGKSTYMPNCVEMVSKTQPQKKNSKSSNTSVTVQQQNGRTDPHQVLNHTEQPPYTEPESTPQKQTHTYTNKNNPQFIGSRLHSYINNSQQQAKDLLLQPNVNGADYNFEEFLEWVHQSQYNLQTLYSFQAAISTRKQESEVEKQHHKSVQALLTKRILDHIITDIVYSDKTKHKQTKNNAKLKKESLISDIHNYLVAANDPTKSFKGFYNSKKMQKTQEKNEEQNKLNNNTLENQLKGNE